MRQLTTAKKMDNGHALTDAEYDVVRPVFNRHLYVSQQAHDWGSRSALNLKLDWAEVQRQCKPKAYKLCRQMVTLF